MQTQQTFEKVKISGENKIVPRFCLPSASRLGLDSRVLVKVSAVVHNAMMLSDGGVVTGCVVECWERHLPPPILLKFTMGAKLKPEK